MGLRDLITDQSLQTEIGDDELDELLSSYIEIADDGTDYGQLNYKESYYGLDNQQQVLVCLFAVEAMGRLDMGKHQIRANALLWHFELDVGTHYPALRSLEQAELVHRTSDGQYAINRFAVEDAVSRTQR